MSAVPTAGEDVSVSAPSAASDGNKVPDGLATDGTHGYELWRTDGTPAGTAFVKDLVPGTADSFPRKVAAIGATAFFLTGTTGEWLWKTDGTDAGTLLVTPSNLVHVPVSVAASTWLFLSAQDEAGQEPWRSDGTEAGTVLLKDVRPGAESSSPGSLASFAGVVHFAADLDTAAFPLPLAAELPLGSLVYQGQVAGAVTPSGNLDNYTLALDAGQTVSVMRYSGARAAGEP